MHANEHGFLIDKAIKQTGFFLVKIFRFHQRFLWSLLLSKLFNATAIYYFKELSKQGLALALFNEVLRHIRHHINLNYLHKFMIVPQKKIPN